jgi:hypothetical protein
MKISLALWREPTSHAGSRLVALHQFMRSSLLTSIVIVYFFALSHQSQAHGLPDVLHQ